MCVLALPRQVDELQEHVERLKAELAAKEDSSGSSSMTALELENLKHLELIADLKLQLEQVQLLSPLLHFSTANCKSRSGRGVLTNGGTWFRSFYRVQRSRRCRRASVSSSIGS